MDVYDHVLNIASSIGKELLQCGASLERANLVMTRILHAYEIHDISLHTLSTNLMISGVDKNGESHIKQVKVAPADINLDRLKDLDVLAKRIYTETPDPISVYGQIKEVVGAKPFPWYYTFIGFLIAMACLCRMFGGTWQEILVSEFNTAALFFMTMGLGKLKMNKIIVNFIAMFVVTSTSLLFAYIGFIANCYTVIITNAFFLINGIGMVNAIRNLLCGNEMNGIIEFFKVCLELVALVAGIAASFFLFGNWYNVNVEDSIVVSKGDFLANLELVFLSLLASIGFAMVFRTKNYIDLALAGLGGVIVRIVYLLLLSAWSDYRVLYASLAALSAAIYAEIVRRIRKRPSTYHLYPSIVPLIPGDLIYYAALGIVWVKPEMFGTNAGNCLLQLVGMSIGFVICSTGVFLFRKLKLGKILLHFNHHKNASENIEEKK
ncbi:MAG: threonine/serine exporter family protein [Bacilli bacterium]|nr:threonine/serine exporter family protein [Bacilli bacterium]